MSELSNLYIFDRQQSLILRIVTLKLRVKNGLSLLNTLMQTTTKKLIPKEKNQLFESRKLLYNW